MFDEELSKATGGKKIVGAFTAMELDKEYIVEELIGK